MYLGRVRDSDEFDSTSRGSNDRFIVIREKKKKRLVPDGDREIE